MSTYVISDIHGCYEQFLLLLEKIRFGADDQLILAGDAIDPGLTKSRRLEQISCPTGIQKYCTGRCNTIFVKINCDFILMLIGRC